MDEARNLASITLSRRRSSTTPHCFWFMPNGSVTPNINGEHKWVLFLHVLSAIKTPIQRSEKAHIFTIQNRNCVLRPWNWISPLLINPLLFLANEPFLGKIGRIPLYLQVKSLDFAVKSLYLPVKSLYLPWSKIPMFSSKIPIFTGKIPMFSSKIPIFTSKIHSFYCFHLRFSLFSLAENRKLPGSVALWCQMMRTPSRMERFVLQRN